MTVPKIKPTSEQVQKPFRRKLKPEQQTAFDSLCKPIDHHRTDLDWYHQVGAHVGQLIPPTVRGRGRIRWLDQPAAAVGVSLALLQKAFQFHANIRGTKTSGN